MMGTLQGKFHAVQMLLHAGADVNIGENDGYTPIHGAGFQGRADIARLLVKQGGMNPNDRHADGYTPMHRAIWGKERRHAETVKVLLELGANLKAKTPRGEVRNLFTPMPQSVTQTPHTYSLARE